MRILIVGQGLAGSSLAWELDRLGTDFLVVDRPLGETASRVAAGLVNPMMGKVFRAGWRQAECMDHAARFYPETEECLGGKWWQRVPIWRELETEDQREIWKERQIDPETSRWAGPMLPWPPGWNGQGMAGYTSGSFVLHAEELTNAIRKWLTETGRFREGEVSPDSLETTEAGILWSGEFFDKIVWAIGWEVSTHPDMAPLKGRPSKGTIIDLKLPGFDWEAGVLHYGHWLVHNNGFWRLGATYSWSWDDQNQPDLAATVELVHSLARHWEGEAEILRYRSAIRPTIRRSQPVAGPLPVLPHQLVFSGLGSKGVTTAPWVAHTLAHHLVQGTVLPPDLTPDVLWKVFVKRG